MQNSFNPRSPKTPRAQIKSWNSSPLSKLSRPSSIYDSIYDEKKNTHERSPVRSSKSITSRYLENLNNDSPVRNRYASPTSSRRAENLLKNILDSPDDNLHSKSSVQTTPKFEHKLKKLEDVSDRGEDVIGMKGRLKLQRNERARETASSNWMDKQRENLQAYEYLCRIGEAKEWVEFCINEEIPPIVELEENLRNGVILAKVTRSFAPHLVKKIYEGKKLSFVHSENINYFFKFVDEIGLPNLFKFELTDLYDKKNIPKVIFCIHALSFILSNEELAPEINNLVGKLQFTDAEIKATQKGLDATGVNMPNFNGMNQHFKLDNEMEVLGLSIAVPISVPELEQEPEVITINEKDLYIIILQSVCRGSILRYNVFTQKYAFRNNIEEMKELQAIIRGKRLRQSTVEQISAKDASDTSLSLQSLIRGNILRKTIVSTKTSLGSSQTKTATIDIQSLIRGIKLRNVILSKLESYNNDNLKYNIVKLQAIIRGKTTKNVLISSIEQTEAHNEEVTLLQSIIRGTLSRIENEKKQIKSHQVSIKNIQAIIRMRKVTSVIKCTKDHLRNETLKIISLQSIARAFLFRNHQKYSHDAVLVVEDGIITLQSTIRNILVRKKINNLLERICYNNEMTTELQSIARGGISRQYLNKLLDDIDYHDVVIFDMQNIIRGVLLRRKIANQHTELYKSSDSITGIQSLFRGVLIRFGYSLMIEDFQDTKPDVVILQSTVRGYLIRKRYSDRMEYFRINTDKIVRLQSYIRARTQGNAYKALILNPNPPLPSVRKFIHLLNDSETDIGEEVKREEGKKKISELVKHNDELEQFVNELDIKIALLVKNKITLDELIRQHKNNKYLKTNNSMNNKLDGNSGDIFNLKGLNKASRVRLELYQGFFYILQTQPIYFVKLFSNLNKNELTPEHIQEIENLVLATFNNFTTPCSDDTLRGITDSKREEYFFIKLICASITEELKNSDSFKSFNCNIFFWQSLMRILSSSNDYRQKLAELTTPVITSICETEDLNLESHPLAIYRSLIIKEEGSRRKSIKPLNVTIPQAIQDPETRVQFVANLQKLREYANEILSVLEEQIDKIPLAIRFICREVHTASIKLFADSKPSKHLSIIGSVLGKHYISLILTNPERFLRSTEDLPFSFNKLQKKNLVEVSELVNRLLLMRPFGRENVYLQPLNEFINVSKKRVQQLLKAIIEVDDIEISYNINPLTDVIGTKRPTLNIKAVDMFSVHSLFTKEISNLLEKSKIDVDPLNIIISHFGSIPSQASEILDLSKFKEIKLDLNPNMFYNSVGNNKQINEEIKINSMFMEAKRCLLYIIQVQKSGDNLLDLLVEKVTKEHEARYESILKDESMNGKKKSTYVEGTLGDLSKLSYNNLKRVALERIIELESFGNVTRKNSFQDLLNSLVVDIRTKHERRYQRIDELEKINEALQNLQKKQDYLQQQMNTYTYYIEKSMSNLQMTSSVSKKKSVLKNLLPFSKQYFHLRSLQKRGKIPKFGSYKYSAQNLYDKGVLVNLSIDILSSGRHGVQPSGKHLVSTYTPEASSPSLKGRLPNIDFTFSSDEIGIFAISASHGSVEILGASTKITVDDLLNKQYDNEIYISQFDGMAQFDTNSLLGLIFKKFYGD